MFGHSLVTEFAGVFWCLACSSSIYHKGRAKLHYL